MNHDNNDETALNRYDGENKTELGASVADLLNASEGDN